MSKWSKRFKVKVRRFWIQEEVNEINRLLALTSEHLGSAIKGLGKIIPTPSATQEDIDQMNRLLKAA